MLRSLLICIIWGWGSLIDWTHAEYFDKKTHILIKLCKGLADSIFYKDHGLSVRPALHSILQGLCYCRVEQRCGRRAVGIAGSESWDNRRRVHMYTAAGKQKVFSQIILNTVLNICA